MEVKSIPRLELIQVAEAVSREKSIDKEEVIIAMEEAIEKAEYYVYSHDYIKEQVLSKDMQELLKSIDEMVKSDNPRKTFEKYKPLFKRLSNTKVDLSNSNHDFF